MVIDSKKFAKNGSVNLDPYAAGEVLQLSDNSLFAVIEKLGRNSSTDQAVFAAIQGGTLVEAVAYVDKFTNELKIVRANVPNGR